MGSTGDSKKQPSHTSPYLSTMAAVPANRRRARSATMLGSGNSFKNIHGYLSNIMIPDTATTDSRKGMIEQFLEQVSSKRLQKFHQNSVENLHGKKPATAMAACARNIHEGHPATTTTMASVTAIQTPPPKKTFSTSGIKVKVQVAPAPSSSNLNLQAKDASQVQHRKETSQVHKKNVSARQTPRPNTSKGKIQMRTGPGGIPITKDPEARVQTATALVVEVDAIIKPILKTRIIPCGDLTSARGKLNKGKGTKLQKKCVFFPGEVVEGKDLKDSKKVRFFDKVLIHPVPYESRGSTEWQHNLMMARENLFQTLMSSPHMNYYGGGLLSHSNSSTGMSYGYDRGAGNGNFSSSRFRRN